MSYRIQCPSCGKVGFVRVEHVIHGHSVVSAYYCGSCNFEWQTPKLNNPAVPPTPDPRIKMLLG